MSHFRHFNDYNSGSKHNQANETVSHLLFKLDLFIGIFHFCILRPSKFTSWNPPFAHDLLYKIYMPKMTLSSMLT